MCTIVGAGPTLPPHKRVFLRNVFNEEIGDLGQCEDPTIGYVRRDNACIDLVAMNGGSSASTLGIGLGMVASAILLVSALIY